jgi:hypothetical protein
MSANSNNKMVLDVVDARLTELDAALARFDSLGEQKIKLQADLKIAEAQEEAILDNESLNHDEAGQQLAQCRSLLDVLKRRLENVTEKITEGQRAVFSAGHIAMEAAFTVWAKLRENREARAKTVFAEHFRLPSHWPVPLYEMWENATLIKEVRPLQFGFQFQAGHSPAAKLDALRTLRGRFESLRVLAEAEPGLVLQSSASRPELTVVGAAA